MSETQTATFAEHIQELRKRVMWIAFFLVAGALLGYVLRDPLIAIMQNPLNERLYYTTPGGAFSFIVKVCTVFGFIVALPMLIYQIFGFFSPLVGDKTKRGLYLYVVASFVLAGVGIVFAYFVSLPAALKFLVNFGNESNIESLITANEYFNFVLTYIAGFAVLFQVPLIVLFADKIKPMPPSKLLGITKYVILASFIVSAVITPTPDPFNQSIMAGPIIVLYLFSVGIVAVRAAARSKSKKPQQATLPTLSQPTATESPLKANLNSLSAEVFRQPIPPLAQEEVRVTPTKIRVSTPISERPVATRIVVRQPRLAYQRKHIISDFMGTPNRTSLSS